MATKNFPCKNCQDRTVGCHGRCADYKEAKAKYDKECAKERLSKSAEKFIIESTIRLSKMHKKNYIHKNYVED